MPPNVLPDKYLDFFHMWPIINNKTKSVMVRWVMDSRVIVINRAGSGISRSKLKLSNENVDEIIAVNLKSANVCMSLISA